MSSKLWASGPTLRDGSSTRSTRSASSSAREKTQADPAPRSLTLPALTRDNQYMFISFVVHMWPVPKGRPRFTVRRGRVWARTPAETIAFEQEFRARAQEFQPAHPLKGPLKLTAFFYLPKAKSSRINIAGPKIDGDNLMKNLKDSMQKTFFENDSQITVGHYEKRFGTPRIEVVLEVVST